MKKIVLFPLLAALLAGNAFAYIDPGTAGSIIGGSIWPLIVMTGTVIAGVFVKIFISPIKGFFRRIKNSLSGKK